MSDFNKNLKAFRQKLGISAKDFAEKLGLKYTTYIAYEDLELNPPREPRYDVLIRMADIFGVSVDALLGREVDNMNILLGRYCRFVEALGFSLYFENDSVVVANRLENMESDKIVTFRDREAFVRNMQVILPFDKFPEGLTGQTLAQRQLQVLLCIQLPGANVEPAHRESLLLADLLCRDKLLEFAKIYDTPLLQQYRKCCELMDEYGKQAFPAGGFVLDGEKVKELYFRVASELETLSAMEEGNSTGNPEVINQRLVFLNIGVSEKNSSGKRANER